MSERTRWSEDEPTPRNSIDILQEEESRENLIARPRPMLTRLFAPRDPNQPREISEKEDRRRRDKNITNRQYEQVFESDEDEELLYEMEEGKNMVDSLSDPPPTSSNDIAPESDRPKTTRKKLRFCTVCCLFFLIMLLILTLGIWLQSSRAKTVEPPAKVPTVLLSNGTSMFAPTTILISLDGFRADFLQRGLTPTLNSLIEQGVSPDYMLPSFPSLTFPNHWTMMTGLHPESHGIVGNTFWDPALGEEFYYTDPLRSMQPKWWTSTGAEPLWATCEKQGVRTAVHMWPGSEAGIIPEPQTVDKYNGKENLSRKVNRVLSFLDRPSEHDNVKVAIREARPQFIAMYVPDVDAAGHRFGPNSTEIQESIRSVDAMLNILLEGIRSRNLASIVNVVVVSDHGMATTSTSRLIQLDDLVDPSVLDHTDGWPLYGLRLKKDIDISKLYDQLVLNCKGKNVTPYQRQNMPERFHFSNSERIAPIWLVPDVGYAIVPKSEFDVAAAIQSNTAYYPRGLHGYDNQHPLMRAIFIARGPAFPHAPNSAVEAFQNIEVYNIVADSLSVEPVSNNGTLRLPFKTIGVHSGHKDVVEDLPPPNNETQPSPVVPDKPETDRPGNDMPVADKPKTDKPKTDTGETSKGGWIAAAGEKLNDLKGWFKDLWDKFRGNRGA